MIGPGLAQYTQPHVYARSVASGAGNCVCGAHLQAPIHTEAAPGVPVPGRDPHQARRGDEVEAWLRRQRGEFGQRTPSWRALDYVLDDYRLHADTGTPLDQDVVEQH
jgi:hypothetical protein